MFPNRLKDRPIIPNFRALADDDRYDVKKENLIDELINTGKFTDDDVLEYIKKAQQDGFILESKLDVYTSSAYFGRSTRY